MSVYGMVQQHHMDSPVLLKSGAGGKSELKPGAAIENLPGRIAARSEKKA